jgi:hypothetical protein
LILASLAPPLTHFSFRYDEGVKFSKPSTRLGKDVVVYLDDGERVEVELKKGDSEVDVAHPVLGPLCLKMSYRVSAQLSPPPALLLLTLLSPSRARR